MSRRTYPQTMPAQWCLGKNRPGLTTCDCCKSPIGPDDPICVIERQVSWFRGDDEVEAFCVVCAKPRGHRPPPTKAERLVEHLKGELTGCQRKVVNLKAEIQKTETRLGNLREELRRSEINTPRIAERLTKAQADLSGQAVQP